MRNVQGRRLILVIKFMNGEGGGEGELIIGDINSSGGGLFMTEVPFGPFGDNVDELVCNI